MNGFVFLVASLICCHVASTYNMPRSHMCCLLDGGAVRHRGREAPRMEGQKMSLNIKWLSESIVFFLVTSSKRLLLPVVWRQKKLRHNGSLASNKHCRDPPADENNGGWCTFSTTSLLSALCKINWLSSMRMVVYD